MCGIAGFVGEGESSDLDAMAQLLIHRGPDGMGQHSEPDNCVYLAHRRLTILDIEAGKQPMWNEDNTIAVVFNGEIYNHRDLRRDLEAKGHTFRSDHSDTEVLVHGYEEWGPELALYLNGMFAFAIYDRPNRTVFLARDRFGKKPLYYCNRPGLFAFASELTALRSHSGVNTGISRRSVQKYLAYGFIPAPNSLYEGVYKLPGGHSLLFELDSTRASIQCYWKFSIEPVSSIPRNPESEWGEELRQLLTQAVERRMISDVPLGFFLSGGIDSTAILAFACKIRPASQNRSFAIGFHEPSFDESVYARNAADLLGCAHAEELLDIDRAKDLIPGVLSHLDEPIGDPSILPTALLCEFARKHVTVAIGGDGGDELFAGYDTFKALAAARWTSRLFPRNGRIALRKLAEKLPLSDRNMSLDMKIRRGLTGVCFPESVWNPIWLAPVAPDELGDIMEEPLSYEELYEEAIHAWSHTNADTLGDRTLEFYTRFYLQEGILTKVDRASMRVSLEVRAPFLDNDVAEFARKIPYHYKYRKGVTKYLLKKALEDILPADIIYRKKKGFGIPLVKWLRDWNHDTQKTVPFLNQRGAAEKWKEHQTGQADHRLLLWCWLTLRYHQRALHLANS